MAAYLFLSYDVTDPETYAKYNPGSMPTIMATLMRHGGKPLSAGHESVWLSGQRQVAVLIEFPSTEAAQAWLADPEYAEVAKHRIAATSNRIELIAPQFAPPTA